MITCFRFKEFFCAFLGVLALLSGGCKEREGASEQLARFQKPVLRWKQELHIAAALRLGDGLALGTTRGGVALADAKGKLYWLLDVDAPPPKKKTKATPAKGDAASRPTSRPVRPRHIGGVSALDVSDDGKRLLSSGGKTIAWWDLTRRSLGRHLRGPHRIKTARFAPDGQSAFFGTDQGHVLRWHLAKGEAKAVAQLGCGARYVDVFRRGRPESERCPYGTYGENKKGQPYCAYPATHLARRGKTLARACRTGTLGVLSLETKAIKHYNMAGALADLHFADDDELLLARNDGLVARYSIKGNNEPQARRKGRAEPTCASSSKKLFAVGHSKSITLWHRDQMTRLGGVRVPAPVVWVELREVSAKGGSLEALLADGQRLSWRFVLEARSRGASAGPATA